MGLGPPWPAAICKEFSNHQQNGSWRSILRSEVPSGRRIHKFVWVFKMKRDGTAKARLCVQGCTLEAGVDYNQTFAKTLSHQSARGLFAYAARERCRVRSVDYVAAYLQGDFIEKERWYTAIRLLVLPLMTRRVGLWSASSRSPFMAFLKPDAAYNGRCSLGAPKLWDYASWTIPIAAYSFTTILMARRPSPLEYMWTIFKLCIPQN